MPLPPLPPDCIWYADSARGDAFDLMVRDNVVAIARRRKDGLWLTRVAVLWAESLQREAIAGSERQAKRWCEGWARAAMSQINLTRPVVPFTNAWVAEQNGAKRASPG
ncbi:hypothetical protein ABIE51_001714 [Lysobacter sp. OAE881]|uniref:hypothetical protein n=1 Tax=Lysobacter sp. OAE881 TaxID=2663813 RepID=UPI0017898E98